jgi:hypothetical protein
MRSRRSGDLRSGDLRGESLRSRNLRSGSLRSRSLKSRDLRGESLRSRSLRSGSLRSSARDLSSKIQMDHQLINCGPHLLGSFNHVEIAFFVFIIATDGGATF